MNATLPPTPERAVQELSRLKPEEREQLLGWLCNRAPALVLDTVRDMREYRARPKGTKP